MSPDSTELPRPPVRGLRRGAYVLPSLFTMGNILLGFYAVVLAHRGNFEQAVWMVILAGVLDGLDGRIARMTHTESEFGMEFDSLADVLTFGATPAYLSYLWGLHELGRLGWIAPLFFLLCTSVRLARYNVQNHATQKKSHDPRYFVGLPSPAAAAVIVMLLFLAQQITHFEQGSELDARGLAAARVALVAALFGVGTLMVSTFRYPSFKRIDLRRRWSYRSAMLLAGLLLLLTFRPQIFVEVAAGVYVLSGPALWLAGKLRRRLPGRRRLETPKEPATE